ncbi:MAG: 2-C-methyl-D-erythritol 2,4-cyclodiphosphate synthase [Spirochaetales bacterium]|nr:2-C-methyl-D-erythritol 2,4-cyclodiphosphate synthase [Spirochaetales bacterium]
MIRIGQGWDIHRLTAGEFLTIGGVKIPFEKKFVAHSDGDVLIHAIIDALLGAANLGDIGTHFPPSEMEFKDINSLELLERSKRLIEDKNFEIINIDSTIIIEKPKMAKHLPQMKTKLAAALSITVEQISIKAKTHEQSDSTGNSETAQAQAICLLQSK